jgi:hypothetical protein
MEFGTPNCQKSWAVVIRLAKTDENTYQLKPRSLNSGTRYESTFDSTGPKESYEGASLARDGIPVQIPQDTASELLLFEAK